MTNVHAGMNDRVKGRLLLAHLHVHVIDMVMYENVTAIIQTYIP